MHFGAVKDTIFIGGLSWREPIAFAMRWSIGFNICHKPTHSEDILKGARSRWIGG